MFRKCVGLLALVTATLPQTAHAQAGWICTADKTVGFSNSTGTWTNVVSAAQPQYMIKPGPGGKPLWQVTPAGRDIVDATCPEDFSRLEVLHCEGLVTEFKFNRKTGRFLSAYLAGYWSYTPDAPFFSKDGRDTPSIEIGTCVPLSATPGQNPSPAEPRKVDEPSVDPKGR